jgi:bifunctional DNA-binding transcriptional regulator/antitoxin component of YhaV-PrlF toxin-antitoxin module
MDKRFILTTNKRGQVTFPKEVMDHCGLPSGGKLKVEFLPDGICKFSPIHPRSHAKASITEKSGAAPNSLSAAADPSTPHRSAQGRSG